MKKLFFLTLICTFISFCLASTPDSSRMRLPLPPRTHKPLPKVKLDSHRSNFELTNLVVFIRFADDPEIDKSFEDINRIFNDSSANAMSVFNYFDAMSYGKIHYNTVYTNQIQNNTIVSYCDRHPRCYFEPYSVNNPEGYPPFSPDSVCPRERQLLADALHYIDSLHLVDSSINLDGNEDGYIDNISFIVKGGCGDWASLLWPHMEFFNDEPYPVTVNGVAPYTFNFELEGSGYYFSANVFCHEMSHSLGLPDLYHYYEYQDVDPVGAWDIMGSNNMQQLNAMMKYKFLGIVDEPIQITEDGDYELFSNATSDVQNCYYIKSSIDSTQWYTIEYRNAYDYMDNVYSTGLLIGRWVDTMDVNNIYSSGDAHFDFYNNAHGYWIFRPGSSSDTINGDLYSAAFGTYKPNFGPTTDPHPYLTDGTPENSFEISNIHRDNGKFIFHVHFLNVGIEEHATADIRIFPNPASDVLNIEGSGIQQVQICDMLGKVVVTSSTPDNHIDISSLDDGIYLVRILSDQGIAVKKFIKR